MSDSSPVSLREYVDRTFAERDKQEIERDKRYEERAKAQQRALDEVKESYNADKKQANEWRGTLNDRDTHYASKESVEALASVVADLTAWRTGQEQFRKGSGATRGFIVGAIGLAATIIGIIATIIAFTN